MNVFNLAEIRNHINTEIGALDFLDKLLNSETVVEFDAENIRDVVSELKWATIAFNVSDVPEDSCITPTVMRAYQDIQTSLYQVASIIEYGVTNTNKLSLDDRKELELYVIINKGSSKQRTKFERN